MHMFNKISIFLFTLLPISLILGNFAVNLNILIIDILTLYLCFIKKNWDWTKEKFFKFLIIFYIFLIFNSLYSYYFSTHETNSGLIRSLTFIKFIIFAYSIKILVVDSTTLNKIMIYWSCIIAVVIFDIFFERIFGINIIGNESPDGTRIVSFFKDELLVGSLILCFGYAITTYYLSQNLKVKNNIIINFLLLLIPVTILITGERSNFIKSLIIFSFIIIFINQQKLILKKRNFIILILLSFLSLIYLNPNIYNKQMEFFKRVVDVNKIENEFIEGSDFFNRFQKIRYFVHYDVSLKIFKEYPLFGVANKNFRHECHNKKYFDEKIKLSNVRCNTHPHQIHFELLSEHGIIGYIFFFVIIFTGLKKIYHNYIATKSIFYLSSLLYLMIFLIPILPSGSFFSTFNGTLFWIIFSIGNIKKTLVKTI